MKEIVNKLSGGVFSGATERSIDARMFRTMAATVALAVIVTVPLVTWKVSTGLLLGGLLSLLNHHWMRTSISAAFDNTRGMKPRIKLARYVLRYVVIAAIVFAAYKLRIVSLPATIVGLCSFVAAFFVEVVREIYLAIIHREETV